MEPNLATCDIPDPPHTSDEKPTTEVDNRVEHEIEPYRPKSSILFSGPITYQGVDPSSFRGILGQVSTSVKPNQQYHDLPPLSFIDIMPQLVNKGNLKQKIPPTFQKFSEIITGANLWLKANPGLSVWKCETIERRFEPEAMLHLDSTLCYESPFGSNVYMFGVRVRQETTHHDEYNITAIKDLDLDFDQNRLWLTRRQDLGEPVQQLGLVSIPPPLKEISLADACNKFNLVASMHIASLAVLPVLTYQFAKSNLSNIMSKGVFLTYEGLEQTVQRFNDFVSKIPLPGRILNVETTTLKFSGFAHNDTDVDVASWYESGAGFLVRRFSKILRVFYVIGPPCNEILYMNTFLPQVTHAPEEGVPPTFESNDKVLSHAQQWLHMQTEIRVVNVESRDAEYIYSPGQPVVILHDDTDDITVCKEERNMIRFLRVFYVSDATVTHCQHILLTSRLFVPRSLGVRKLQSMTQLMLFTNAWLNITSTPIFSVETVPYLMPSHYKSLNTERADYKYNTFTSNYWVTCIKLYFSMLYEEPSPDLLPDSPNGLCTSVTCSIL